MQGCASEASVDVDELARRVDAAGVVGDLKEIAARRGKVFEYLADSSDPLLRELGRQLRDGMMTPRDILRVPDYTEAMFHLLHAHGKQSFLDLLLTLDERLGQVEKRRNGESA